MKGTEKEGTRYSTGVKVLNHPFDIQEKTQFSQTNIGKKVK